MNYFKLTVFILGIFSFSFCKGQTYDGKSYNQNYIISFIPDIDGFMKYNKLEIQQDSINARFDKAMDTLMVKDSVQKTSQLFGKKNYRYNRSRIFIDLNTNGIPDTKDSTYYLGLPTPCQCYTGNDTLFVKMGLGFFGGFGFNIAIFKNDFQSNFFEYTDDVKPYKYSLTDTASYSYITAKNKYHIIIYSTTSTNNCT